MKQRKNTEVFGCNRGDLNNSSKKKRSQFQSIISQSKIFSDTSHEVWNAGAQSSARDGCPSQSTQNNVHPVSTNQSVVPTPRLPNELLALENVERAYSAMKAGLRVNDMSPRLIRVSPEFEETVSEKQEPENQADAKPLIGRKEPLQRVTERSEIQSGLQQKDTDPVENSLTNLKLKTEPLTQTRRLQKPEDDNLKIQSTYQFKFTQPTCKTPSAPTASQQTMSTEALHPPKQSRLGQISLTRLSLPFQGLSNTNKKITPSNGSLTASRKRLTEGS